MVVCEALWDAVREALCEADPEPVDERESLPRWLGVVLRVATVASCVEDSDVVALMLAVFEPVCVAETDIVALCDWLCVTACVCVTDGVREREGVTDGEREPDCVRLGV